MDIDRALEILAAGRREAERIAVPMSLAVVDEGGHLVTFARMAGASFLTVQMAIGKAHTAAGSKLSTAVLEQSLAEATHIVTAMATSSNGRFLVVGGGEPIDMDGEFVGAVGVSGGSSDQDAQVARAAAE